MTLLLLSEFVDPATGLAWMERSDLDVAIGPANVDRIFADDTGSGRANPEVLNTVLAMAERKVVSLLLRAFTVEEIIAIMNDDQMCRSSCAYIAAEYGSRRKGDFSSEDGKGRYYQSFKEAVEHFEKMSHGATQTPTKGVTNAQEGGTIKPPIVPDGAQPFIFAPRNNFRGPGGRGGF